MSDKLTISFDDKARESFEKLLAYQEEYEEKLKLYKDSNEIEQAKYIEGVLKGLKIATLCFMNYTNAKLPK